MSSILNYQGSITETRNSDRPSESTAQSGAVSIPSVVPSGRNKRPGAATLVAIDFSSPKSSFPILLASDLNLSPIAKPEVSIPARIGNPAIFHIFISR